jgi:hypothetical protein
MPGAKEFNTRSAPNEAKGWFGFTEWSAAARK